MPGVGQADAIARARHRREVADHRDRRLARRAEAQPGEDRLRRVVDDDPAEALGLAVARMQGGRSR